MDNQKQMPSLAEVVWVEQSSTRSVNVVKDFLKTDVSKSYIFTVQLTRPATYNQPGTVGLAPAGMDFDWAVWFGQIVLWTLPDEPALFDLPCSCKCPAEA